MLIPESVHIWRDAAGDYHIDWESAHPELELAVEPLATAVAQQVAGQRRARVVGLPRSQRHYFRLRDQHGNEALGGERRLAMNGTPNFRDFGGYRGDGGKRVKWGYLYRSGQLSTLSDEDLDLLGSLQLDLVCDFRRSEEQAMDPSRLPANNPPRIASLPIVPGSNSSFLEEAARRGQGRLDFNRQAMFDFMVEINRDFVDGQRAVYAEMFREILATDEARFLVHCAAGKDRTGFAVALVLAALGVAEEQILRDYMLTAEYFHPDREMERLKRKYAMEHVDSDAVKPMLEVHEDYLRAALADIEARYGSLDRYLDEALGVGAAEVAELRRRYLE